MNNKLFFYGTDCPHCDAMRPLIAKLAFDTEITLDERDVWTSQADFRIYENYQDSVKKKDPECDGLPFFYDVKTKEYLCGEVSYRALKTWAMLK
jgi:thiol-disulfide isomerase/thioredoxin